MDEKTEKSQKELRKNHKKALEALERICSSLQIPFDEKFSLMKKFSAKEKPIPQVQSETHEVRKEITRLIKEYYLQDWLEITKLSYEGSEYENMFNSLQLMVKLEPVHSYDYYTKLFEVLKGLCSEDETVVMHTLFVLRESASELSTEEIINSYGELVRSKFKDPVIYAIIDGTKRSKNKKNTEYISSYFNEKKQRGEE